MVNPNKGMFTNLNIDVMPGSPSFCLKAFYEASMTISTIPRSCFLCCVRHAKKVGSDFLYIVQLRI